MRVLQAAGREQRKSPEPALGGGVRGRSPTVFPRLYGPYTGESHSRECGKPIPFRIDPRIFRRWSVSCPLLPLQSRKKK
jgi:hypothetical protein